MPKAAALDLLAALLAVWGYLGGGGAVPADSPDQDFLMVTVATEETDGFRRFMYSANKYGLHVKVFGMGLKWDGGDVARYAGGGHKINILKDGLKDYVDRNLTVMYVDSYDVVFTNGSERILDFFRRFKAKVVFSAEGFCWPDESLVSKYPPVGPDEKRFLNSGGFIGNIKEVYEIVTYKKIMNQDDDQLYYTEIFLDEDLRERWNIKLDTKGMIFQNLNGALGEVMLKFKGNRSYLYNVKTKKLPVVIHGNGPIKPEFNRIANYLSDGWTSSTGCQSCKEDVIRLSELKEDDYPPVLVAIFIEHPAPFLREFFEKIAALTYPKKHIDIFLHNSIEYHKPHVEEFLKVVRSKYKSINVVSPEDMVNEVAARNWAIQESIQKSHKYLFSVDPVAHLDNPDTLQLLIEQNRSIVAPVLVRPQKLWSNFWGALSQEGFYTRSEDYLDIVSDKKIGLWNVPYISSVMLIQGHSLKTLYDAYSSNYLDPDMSFAKTCRDKGIFMFASNREKFGHLISNENFDTTFTSSELFEIMENPLDWEKRYIHENYSRSLHDDFEPLQPCPDVFWFPVTTEHFCKELIALMENYGKWSSGKSLDPRLAGGYENVPTVDIHMKQVGLEKHWLQFLWKYVTPLQRKAFAGYFNEPPNAIMNFVVRYKPDEQPSLRPHHDSSTYTINIALNHPQIDFEGGGCRFIRYNCSVRNTRKGWMLMHPGRLTHFHEGLQVTNGTRYIMISFVDP